MYVFLSNTQSWERISLFTPVKSHLHIYTIAVGLCISIYCFTVAKNVCCHCMKLLPPVMTQTFLQIVRTKHAAT